MKMADNTNNNNGALPSWHYSGPDPTVKPYHEGENAMTYPALEGPNLIDLGSYCRAKVSNVGETESLGRRYFDLGLRLMLSYQHEMASKCFLACLSVSPYCALAHGLVALCHSPNYNFKGEAYYESAHHLEDEMQHDLLCVFPSQQVADRHSRMAIEKVEELRRQNRSKGGKKSNKKGKRGGKGNKNKQSTNKSAAGTNGDAVDGTAQPGIISDVESQLLYAIRILTCNPGVDPSLSEETVGRPYAEAMRKVYNKFPNDPEVAYCFAEALMVLNAWQLYEFPTGKPVSPDVVETRDVLETSLQMHKNHAGLCHMYVHLSEMSAHPGLALKACRPLRKMFPHAGHLIHMATHIDVLVGDYESCVRYNYNAILADQKCMEASPQTAGTESFYFGYIVHNYHMAVYGAILGGMEKKAMEIATELNKLVNESMFMEYPDLTAYLESYSALEVHVMIRFGRWQQIIDTLELPKNKKLMLYRAAAIKFAKGLAYAALGDIVNAKKEADRFDTLRKDSECHNRILHNNSVAQLLEVDATMLRGEIFYREGKYTEAFNHLRNAVELQDNLNYDEPWGKMQPIRHALGGLLLEQGHVTEAMSVFKKDLCYHPRNPWALVGLIKCYQRLKNNGEKPCCSSKQPTTIKLPDDVKNVDEEIKDLHDLLKTQRQSEWADFDVAVACECCRRPG